MRKHVSFLWNRKFSVLISSVKLSCKRTVQRNTWMNLPTFDAYVSQQIISISIGRVSAVFWSSLKTVSRSHVGGKRCAQWTTVFDTVYGQFHVVIVAPLSASFLTMQMDSAFLLPFISFFVIFSIFNRANSKNNWRLRQKNMIRRRRIFMQIHIFVNNANKRRTYIEICFTL